MKNPVKIDVVRITNDTSKLQNAINSLDALVEKVEPLKKLEKRIIEPVTKKAEKVKVEKKVTFKEQIEGNKLFNEAKNLECKKLGYALGLLEKHIECFTPLVRQYIRDMRNEQHLYKLAELKCAKSKSGNFTPWLLQNYIRNTINNA